MALFRVPVLPEPALEASAAFHAQVLPGVLARLAAGPDDLVLVFAPADHTHRGWRLALVQQLAREQAPVRVNAVESDDEPAIAAAEAFLANAAGLTGQLLPLDSHGAGDMLAPG